MLQRRTIEPSTLDLLNTLLKIPILNSFYLVGGTALALKFGHRISIDLDLFSIEDFNKEKVIQELANSFPSFVYKADNSTIGVFCTINGIKVDLIKNHWFKLIDEIDEIEGVRMFGNKDLIAMKISAILKRGQKKDFYDLCQLLKIFSIQNGIDFYHEKFPNQQLLISIPNAITYFADAEESPEPISLNGQTWEEIKKSIQKAVRDFL
jgi:hypothetical protein